MFFKRFKNNWITLTYCLQKRDFVTKNEDLSNWFKCQIFLFSCDPYKPFLISIRDSLEFSRYLMSWESASLVSSRPLRTVKWNCHIVSFSENTITKSSNLLSSPQDQNMVLNDFLTYQMTLETKRTTYRCD
jgi:hypothetical protein